MEPIYAIGYLDAVFLKLRRKGSLGNVVIDTVLAVEFGGHRDLPGHFIVDDSEVHLSGCHLRAENETGVYELSRLLASSISYSARIDVP